MSKWLCYHRGYHSGDYVAVVEAANETDAKTSAITTWEMILSCHNVTAINLEEISLPWSRS